MKIRTIASHYALLPDGVLANPLVVAEGSRIVSIGQYDPATVDRIEGVEFYAGILAPAMINAHCHLELSYLRGAIEPDCGYAGFAAGMARVRNSFADEERHRAAVAADREMYDTGTVAAGDIANDRSAFAAKAAGRVRYRTFAEVFGLRTPSIEAARQLLEYPDTTLTPHSTYSLNDSIFRPLCSEGDATLSIHFMESPAEQQLYDGGGSLREWYDTQGFECDFLHYGSPAERIAACVPSGRSVMLVHCCCVTQRDIDIILSHFTAPVYWVLCPRSNDYISGLRPDVGLLRRNGLKICIGTDSLASNRSLEMLEELKCFAEVPLTESLRWATQNGAEALGLSAEGYGSLSEGSECGLIAISGLDYSSMTLTTDSTLIRIL